MEFECPVCGAPADGLKGDWRENESQTGQTLYCPNGHPIGFSPYPPEE